MRQSIIMLSVNLLAPYAIAKDDKRSSRHRFYRPYGCCDGRPEAGVSLTDPNGEPRSRRRMLKLRFRTGAASMPTLNIDQADLISSFAKAVEVANATIQ